MNKKLNSFLQIMPAIMIVVCTQAVKGTDNYSEKLLPASCYGQAVEICMRVLTDQAQLHDQDTATDLCLGRLLRLSEAVVKMEKRHVTKRPFPSEDIWYMLGLINVVAKERKSDLVQSNLALSLISTIEMRLGRLLYFP